MGQKVPIVDPRHPIDYSKPDTPPSYTCGKCGATGCKLWRDYQRFLNHQTLRCARCAAKSEDKDIQGMGADGRYNTDYGMTDQIGWYVPAVPTQANDTFWGYTSVPEAGCEWWRKLPTFPNVSPQASARA